LFAAAAVYLPALSLSAQTGPAPADPLVSKVRSAALAMQRKSWEQGVLAQAIFEEGDDAMVVQMARASLICPDKNGLVAALGGAPVDPLMLGESLWHAGQVSDDPDLRKAAQSMLDYTLHRAPRAGDGTIFHTGRTIWSDSFHTSPPFLAFAGYPAEAIRQIDGHWKHLWNPQKRLLAHIWNEDKQAFDDPAAWGGGNGWAAAALTRVIRSLPADAAAEKSRLAAMERQLIDGCLAHQRPDGLFYNVVDDDTSFVETDLGQMLAFSIYESVRGGWLPSDYLPAADRMRIAARAKVDRDGFVRGVAGAPTFRSPGISPEGQAFFLMMEAAAAKLGRPAPAAPSMGGHPFACTDYTQGKVFIVSADGRVEWEYPAQSCNDIWVLPNGNLLFNTGHGVKEVTREKRTVFAFESKSAIYACQRLANGDTFIGECNSGRLLEVAPDGRIAKEVRLLPEGQDGGGAFMRNARRLDNGHYLVAHYGLDVVREYDGSGRVVMEIPAPGGPHSAIRLPDGDTLIACADRKSGQPHVFEVDSSGKMVWEVNASDLPGIPLMFMTGLQRLPNGNTVMTNWLGHNHFGQAPHVIEVTRDKKVVWSFADHATMRTISSIQLLDVPGDVTRGEIWH
jgi:rhamnogalacturonyl hydrolase YesR